MVGRVVGKGLFSADIDIGMIVYLNWGTELPVFTLDPGVTDENLFITEVWEAGAVSELN